MHFDYIKIKSECKATKYFCRITKNSRHVTTILLIPYEAEGERAQEVKQWYVNLKELTKEELRDASINSAIFHIYRTNWCLKVVERVLEKVKEFYQYGETYYGILTKAYLNEEDKKDLAVAEELQLDRSTYYRRKKEAVLLCGILMWEEAREKCFA